MTIQVYDAQRAAGGEAIYESSVPPATVPHEAALDQSWQLLSYLPHEAELDQAWALTAYLPQDADIGQSWALQAAVLDESVLNQRWTQNATQIHQSTHHQAWSLWVVTGQVTSVLNQSWALWVPVLDVGQCDQRWALAAYLPHYADLGQRWSLDATAIWQPVITAVHYTCILTGAADGLPDLVLPISSFQGRLRSGSPSYLSVVVPASAQYADAIDARFNGQLVISRGDRWTDGTVDITEIARVNLESIRFDEGAKSASAGLSGHRQTTNTAPKTVALTGAQVRMVNKGLRRYRCAMNNDLRPGDTAEINGETLVVREISYTVGPTLSQMEINE